MTGLSSTRLKKFISIEVLNPTTSADVGAAAKKSSKPHSSLHCFGYPIREDGLGIKSLLFCRKVAEVIMALDLTVLTKLISSR